MGYVRWLSILAGIPVGLFTPLQYQLLAGVALLIGYGACQSFGWLRFQQFLAWLFGGLATGAGFQVLAGYGIKGHLVPMVVAPALLWLATRIAFMAAEERYSLMPKPALLPAATGDVVPTGASAWSGESSGGSSIPDRDGRRILWNFYATGELCMGGPTYGDAVFSNACAFQDVGPSIVIADDGHYAALPLPSRGAWGLLLADLRDKCAYLVGESSLPWEIDAIQEGAIFGRESPLTANSPSRIELETILARAERQPMIEDGGWWVIDSPEREPFPKYQAVTIFSSGKLHEVLFVPDLRPFKSNPFAQYRYPEYSILVDRQLLNEEVRFPLAVWIDAPGQEGRFLEIGDRILDFMPEGKFDVGGYRVLNLAGGDAFPAIQFSARQSAGPGELQADGVVMFRSVGFSEAESWDYSTTHPYDDVEVNYWDGDGRRQTQSRTLAARLVRYFIDLPAYSRGGKLREAARLELLNRARPECWARLDALPDFGSGVPYSPYRCATSCGVDPGPVIGEAVWSRCGRYLAVVPAVAPPEVPARIRIIDFTTATWRDLPGYYPLPSFIWFDESMLDFSYLSGIVEILDHPGRPEERRIGIDDPGHAQAPYALLIGSLAARRAAGGSVYPLVQHCILFAPEFSVAVPQQAPADEQ